MSRGIFRSCITSVLAGSIFVFLSATSFASIDCRYFARCMCVTRLPIDAMPPGSASPTWASACGIWSACRQNVAEFVGLLPRQLPERLVEQLPQSRQPGRRLVAHLQIGFEPGVPREQLRVRRPVESLQGLLQLGDPGLQVRGLLLLGSGRQGERRLVAVVEEGEQPVVLALADRVVLVIVTLAAADGQAEEDGAGGVDAIDDRLDAEHLDVDAPLLVRRRVAVKTRGDPIRLRRLREQIAGKLIDDEAIDRQVMVQGVDDPVAVGPHRAGAVDREAVRIAVAGQVEPVPGPAFAVVGRRQQPIDESLVSVGPAVGEEIGDFLRRRRQADEIEADPANQGRAIGLGRRRQLVLPQPGEDEAVDRVADPRIIADIGKRGPGDRLERPVVAVDVSRDDDFVLRDNGAGIDPAANRRDLLRLQPRPRQRRHRGHVLGAEERLHEATLRGLAGDDDLARVVAGNGGSRGVETEAGFLIGGAVAADAVFLKDRLDVLDEIVLGGRDADEEEANKAGCKQTFHVEVAAAAGRTGRSVDYRVNGSAFKRNASPHGSGDESSTSSRTIVVRVDARIVGDLVDSYPVGPIDSSRIRRADRVGSLQA